MYISERILITIKVALKQHWEDSIRSQLMQDTPDELSSNADTVSRDHDIARNIPVLELVSLLLKWFVIRIWIIRMPKSFYWRKTISNLQHKAQVKYKILWDYWYTFKVHYQNSENIVFNYLSTCHTYGLLDAILEKKEESQSHVDFQIN